MLSLTTKGLPHSGRLFGNASRRVKKGASGTGELPSGPSISVVTPCRTKISPVYLEAIEADDYGALPALVYVRGFVTEVAKYLKLDVMQVTRTYLKRYREWRNQQEQVFPR